MKSSEKPEDETTSSSQSGSWQLKFVLMVIIIGVLGLIGKAIGLI